MTTMSAGYVSSKLITIVQRGARSLRIEFVDKSTAWIRPPDFPSASVKMNFAQVAEENVDLFEPETTTVAMKYAPPCLR